MSRFYALQRHALYVLIAAALFGASAPLAKRLLEQQSPLSLAALVYLGGGLALGIAWLLRRRHMKVPRAHGRWTASELANLVGAIIAGGVLAPIILFWSLSKMPAASASLLLSFEGLLTAVFAAVMFHEAVARRVWLAMLIMIIAGAVLSLDRGEFGLQLVPAGGVILACALWGLDNNLTRAVSHRDILGVAALKGLVAGATNTAVAALLGHSLLVSVQGTLGALAMGALSFGLSLVLFVSALAHLGSARTAAHFGTAPFIGAALAVLLGEPLSLSLIAAVVLTVLSTWLVLTETHEHGHTHETIDHEHAHVHDEHHQHGHEGDEGPEPHRHRHRHEPLSHSHSHLPDLHHRHRH
ncbi:drug/metabolite transporter (DMT)-like permease [Povalibacter uvarum]|uniref:Drug/metabolite transporter (DMT)-like permease n=1 Tax=Povalibacter uvarum TaxID=732238 RepID=A0A841HNY5_9GAMM|nr:DMT family transporter [Povalibacter uvarum]MBB6095001.1 drug/metabolite transporter (DMT)-like permease [Povalibacter uvarum]